MSACWLKRRTVTESARRVRHNPAYHSYGVPHFYRGQELKKLERSEEAKPLFEALIERGRRALAQIETSTGISFFAKFGDPTLRDFGGRALNS
jgi:hypothetical protein